MRCTGRNGGDGSERSRSRWAAWEEARSASRGRPGVHGPAHAQPPRAVALARPARRAMRLCNEDWICRNATSGSRCLPAEPDADRAPPGRRGRALTRRAGGDNRRQAGQPATAHALTASPGSPSARKHRPGANRSEAHRDRAQRTDGRSSAAPGGCRTLTRQPSARKSTRRPRPRASR